MQKHNPISPFSKQQEDDIREAVFRYHMNKLIPLYFLSINNTAPSPAFMTRFHSQLNVRTYSAVNRQTFEVTEKKTGKSGVILTTNNIRRIAANQAKVETYWLRSKRGGMGGTCLVQQKQDQWRVVYFQVQFKF